MGIELNILAKIVSVAFLAQVSPQSAAPVSSAPSSAVSVKRTPRATVVFLPHTGAYWSIGPTIAKVRAAQRDPATLYVRYSSDPRRISPSQLEARVGFVIEIGKEAPPGFQTQILGSELVASMSVDDSASSLARHYTRLQAWARQNGYRSTGPVIELYSPLKSDSNRVEIQLVVEKANERPAPPAILAPPPAPKSETQTPPGTPPEATRAGETADPSPPRRSETMNVTPSEPRAQVKPPDPTPRRRPRSRPHASPRRDDVTPDEYDLLALRVIPPREEWTQVQAASLGSTIMRVRAIAYLAKTKFGTDSSHIFDLSFALTERYTHVWGSQLASSFKEPRKTDRNAAPRVAYETLQQLDRVFSELLTGQLDAETVHATVLDILTNESPDDFQPEPHKLRHGSP